jgi:5-methylcytosine-specific restriction endonuclease McrA
MQIISRDDAKKSGLAYYFTGLPCSKGHVAKKQVSSYSCYECATNRKKEKEERRGIIRRPRNEEERKERRLAALKKYEDANPEKLKESQRKYKAAHPEKRKTTVASWQKRNPEALRIKQQNRRAQKFLGGGVSKGIQKKLFDLQRGLCPCCLMPLGEDYHLDHRMPLALGGEHEDRNMQLLRAICNLQKSAKHPVDFMQSRGFLL